MNAALAQRPCKNHPREAAVVRCGACGIHLCDRCFAFTIGAAPGCARCAFEIETRPARKPTFAVTFVGILLGGSYFVLQRFDAWRDLWPYVVVLGVLAAGGATFWAWPRADGRARLPEVKPRDERALPPPRQGPTASPYRATARAIVLGVTPRVSARWTILLLVGAFATTTALVPALLRLPRWIESEIVLVTWWLVFTGVLSTLLYRGYRLRHDFEPSMPWEKRPLESAVAADAPVGVTRGQKESSGCNPFDGCSSVGDVEGLVFVLVGAVAIGVALGLAWLVVNLAAPLLFVVLYALLGAAIRRVAHDAHGLRGKLLPAIGWGALWSTLYVTPLVLLVWLFHLAARV